jgi:hypothetical protein
MENYNRLYHFNPNDYGPEFFVMSDSEENAIKALNKHLKESEYFDFDCEWKDEYFKPKSVQGVLVHNGYTIDVYEQNQVIESEIA